MANVRKTLIHCTCSVIVMMVSSRGNRLVKILVTLLRPVTAGSRPGCIFRSDRIRVGAGWVVGTTGRPTDHSCPMTTSVHQVSKEPTCLTTGRQLPLPQQYPCWTDNHVRTSVSTKYHSDQQCYSTTKLYGAV